MASYGERNHALLAIDTLCARYPQYSVQLQSLVFRDRKFRAICEDFWDASQAAEAQKTDEARKAEFENIANDLLAELFEYFKAQRGE